MSKSDKSYVENLRQLVYVSSASRLLRDAELVEILETSRSNNSKTNVTGVLLYADGSFIQVLEGEPTIIERILRKIRRDERHRGFLTLLDRMIVERDFPEWNMGFQRVSRQELDQIAGYFDWSAEMPTRRKQAAAVRLIESFRRTAVLHK